ncbi:CaiB/BaiF CoA transferase family protein [Gordonia sp. NPDC127522]|uniref:CaiB/BaiF CoA transferase family protein n=1 Tax=Gordonia sp. NPDC127522 TaxID=3345390 RepID=UPI00363E6D45
MKHNGPLSGVRVIDLTAMVMGPYCTQILADMGADVVKVEPPGGDDTRRISVGPEPGMSGVFANVNRGKRSVVLDLRTPEGVSDLNRLIADADVFIHSMRASAIDRLGFSYDAVRQRNSSIIYTNCYGYGRRGPHRDRTAYDDTIQAECGMADAQRQLTGATGYVGTILADKVAGMTAVYATVMALFHRERSGDGQEIEVPMFETMAAFMLVEHANGAMFESDLGPAAYPRAVTRHRRPYRTRDGYISAMVYNDKQWNAFVSAVQPDWAGPHLATLAQRAARIDDVYTLLAGTFAERHTDDWLELLRSLGVPAAPVLSLDELFQDDHLDAVGFFHTVDSPYGPIRYPGPPTWFSLTAGAVSGPAPRLGAHTTEVLADLSVNEPTNPPSR